MKTFFQKYLNVILVILVVVLGASTASLYKKTQTSDPAAAAAAETASVVAKVGKLMLLPEGETPTVATVSDPAALQNQPFFNGSKQGDKVLIYTNSKKAILYDPVLNKIVNIAPVNIGEGAPAKQ